MQEKGKHPVSAFQSSTLFGKHSYNFLKIQFSPSTIFVSLYSTPPRQTLVINGLELKRYKAATSNKRKALAGVIMYTMKRLFVCLPVVLLGQCDGCLKSLFFAEYTLGSCFASNQPTNSAAQLNIKLLLLNMLFRLCGWFVVQLTCV